jgi:hypothetical protein
MTILKWITGIILACALTVGFAGFLMHALGIENDPGHNWFKYWIISVLLPSLSFCLFVILTCWLIPSYKKYAGILVILLSLTFIGFGVYQHWLDNGYLPNIFLFRYIGFIIGLSTGFYWSHRIFNNKGWNVQSISKP